MFCTKCGKEIADDSLFCKYCGAKVRIIDDAPEKRVNKSSKSKGPKAEKGKCAQGSSEDIDLEEMGRTVKRKLSEATSQIGETAKTKVKAAMESEEPSSDETDSDKEFSAKKSSGTDWSEFALIVVVGIVLVLIWALIIPDIVARNDDSSDSANEKPVVSTDTAGVDHKEPEVPADDSDAPRHAVRLFVEFESNWFFDKYDAEVSVDGQALGTLPHGEDGSYDLELTDREHTFSVKDTEGVGRTGSAAFDTTGLSIIGFNIDVGDDRIYVERLETVAVPIGSNDVAGKSRQEVEDAFRDAGFDNVTVSELGDLPLDRVGEDGAVASVTVKGSNSFAADDAFFPDDEVVINVHTPAKLKAPLSSTALLGMNYEDARAQLESAGFIVECKPTSFYDDDYSDWEVKEVAVNVLFAPSDFEEGAEFDYGTGITLYYNEPQVEEEPQAEETNDWDQWWDARRNFETYGEILYPYGFKCHWILNLIAEEPQGDGTYFIKVGVTITNAFGQKREAIAQGIAGNGAVKDFYVSWT